MKRTESTTQLIQEESELCFTNDYSSGYESASGSSDNELQQTIEKTANLSLLDKIWEEDSPHATKEKMNYHNTADLASHLRYVMSMPELCDVTFLVGHDRIPVYGVKAIMGARSRVIYNLILKRQRELEFEEKRQRKSKGKKTVSNKTGHHLLITVQKYQPGDFRNIVEFLHCGSIDISTSNVVGLLCGASQFELDDLTRACWDFIDHCSRNGSTSLLIPAARRYSQYTSGKLLISLITRSFKRTSMI